MMNDVPMDFWDFDEAEPLAAEELRLGHAAASKRRSSRPIRWATFPRSHQRRPRRATSGGSVRDGR